MNKLCGVVAVVLSFALSGCAAQKEALALEGNARKLRGELARMFVNKGAYVAATPYVQNALKESPDDPEMLTLYGVVLRESGLYPQAEQQFRRALTLKPGHAPAWGGLAMLYDLQKRSALALDAHHKAVELEPQNGSEWNNLGFSLYVAGQNEEAVAALEKALALSPGLVVAYNNLGFAYSRLGNFDAARRCFLSVGGDHGAESNTELAVELAAANPEPGVTP